MFVCIRIFDPIFADVAIRASGIVNIEMDAGCACVVSADLVWLQHPTCTSGWRDRYLSAEISCLHCPKLTRLRSSEKSTSNVRLLDRRPS